MNEPGGPKVVNKEREIWPMSRPRVAERPFDFLPPGIERPIKLTAPLGGGRFRYGGSRSPLSVRLLHRARFPSHSPVPRLRFFLPADRGKSIPLGADQGRCLSFRPAAELVGRRRIELPFSPDRFSFQTGKDSLNV
ncbi:Hypothetical protein NTJ_01038 [Nesidiocoris tenuis]|uniref:Uncharacterized protein n=1 Tax=Nesidiocoris tenuis TaxID=355587 RepID=A0ABN7AAH9_9HEMI|nr:Hypothetical protein NTJ_01038 [Nesidiocoris tenuis]